MAVTRVFFTDIEEQNLYYNNYLEKKLSRKSIYKNKDAVIKSLKYITRTDFNTDRLKTKGPALFVYGAGVPNTNIFDMAISFMALKSAFQKTDGRQINHMIFTVSYEDEMMLLNYGHIVDLGLSICDYIFKEGYQVVFAIHRNQKFLHYHFIMNSISYYDGNFMNINYREASIGLTEFFKRMIDYYTGRITNKGIVNRAGKHIEKYGRDNYKTCTLDNYMLTSIKASFFNSGIQQLPLYPNVFASDWSWEKYVSEVYDGKLQERFA